MIDQPPAFLDDTRIDRVGPFRTLVKRGERGRGFFCKHCGTSLNDACNKIPNDGRLYVIACRCGLRHVVDAGKLATLIVVESQRITKEA